MTIKAGARLRFGLVLVGLAALSAAMFSLPHSRTPARRAESSPISVAGSFARRGAAGSAKAAFALAAFEKLPLSFEANRGQADSHVRFLARSRDFALFILPGEALLASRPGTGAKPQEAARVAADVRNRRGAFGLSCG